MRSLAELRRHLPQVGSVHWIGLSPARRAPIREVEEVMCELRTGLVGDRHAPRGGARQVSLIQWEHFAVLSALLGREVRPVDTRRNLAVRGINLLALRTRRFQVGEAILEGNGRCAPCSRMEENLGEGGYQAMRGHGGITAQVIRPGRIALGDPVRVLPEMG